MFPEHVVIVVIVVIVAPGKIPGVRIASYSAAKFALDGFFSSVSQEILSRKLPVTITLCVFGAIGKIIGFWDNIT